MSRTLCCAFASLALVALASRAADEILVVEQEYNIVEQDKEGVKARDILQRLYLSKDWVRIDEFAGSGKTPTETYLIDLKREQIVDLDNEDMKKTTETFAQRRERIEKRKEKARTDIQNQPEGPQLDKLKRMYKGLLDDERKYRVRVQPKETKELAEVKAERVDVEDGNDKEYAPFKAWLHPDQEVPYDSAEVLYLLQIIGKKMAEFMRKNKSVFRRVPMEMSLELAAGGTLHTKVLKIEKKPRDESLMLVPEGFQEKRPPKPPKPKVSDDDDPPQPKKE